VDGLHARAGNLQLLELHGNIHKNLCFDELTEVEASPGDERTPPRCPRCQAWLRPAVVWFGEPLPAQALQDAQEAARTCDVFLSIGTSGLVQPAASLALVAKNHGALLVEVNPSVTPLTAEADVVLTGKAGDVLPQLVAELSP
jgi:NAD-dependent deacetylase